MQSSQPSPAKRGRFATRRSKIVLLVSVLVLCVACYSAVELTSVPGFCHSCHEIDTAQRSWASSPHATIKGKTRATCRECHLPSWREPWAVVWTKIWHGGKDGYHHFAGHARPADPMFYFELKQKTLAGIDDGACLGCHADVRGAKDIIRVEETGEVFRGLHASDEARKVRCVVCHKNTGHTWFD